MNDVQRFLQRPQLYYNIDDVGDLGMGFMCLSYALLEWLQSHAPRDSAWHQMYTFAIYVTVMLAIIHYGSKTIKNRITYRRTGFVDYRPRDKYWLPMGLGFGISALLGVVLYLAVRRHWEISTPGSVVGLVFAVAYIRLARTVHWKWVVFCLVVAGALAIAVLPVDLVTAVVNHASLTSAVPAKVVGAYWLTFVLCGALMMASGAISFWLYLKHTEAPAQEAE